MTKFISATILVLGVSLVATAKHHGDGHHGGKAHAGPCAKDKETLCAAIKGGGHGPGGHGEMVKCLKENETKLSAECGAHIKEANEAMKDVREACHGDFDKFCHDIKPGGGRVIKCMKAHEAELSVECKAELAEKKEKRGKKN